MTHDYPNLQALKNLANSDDTPSVSLYMPTARGEPESRQNRIRFGNLLREAEAELARSDVADDQRSAILRHLEDRAADDGSWRTKLDGLALFATPTGLEEHLLPYEAPERISVGPPFVVSPLLPLPGEDETFFVVALSLNDARLFEARGRWIREIELTELKSRLELGRPRSTSEQSLQFHTGTPGGGEAPRPAVFHAQGGIKDAHEEHARRRLRTMAEVIGPNLDDRKAPILVASVDHLRPIFREVAGWSNLLDDGPNGNPEDLSAAQLLRLCFPYARDHFLGTAAHFREALSERIAAERGSRQLAEIVRAAYDGRIETLYLPRDRQRWGTFDPARRELHLHDEPGTDDDDLYNLAAVWTLRHGGKAYGALPAELPIADGSSSDEAELAAFFRH